MTREEIKYASKDYVNYLLDKQEYHNEKYTEDDIRQAFEKGAMIANNNPDISSLWHDASEMPNNHSYIMLMIDRQDKVSDFCLDQADKTRNSSLRNYDNLTAEQRERLAKLWESAMNLPDGNYDYYFNLEDKTEVFIKSVQELAEKLGIDYELIIKEY